MGHEQCLVLVLEVIRIKLNTFHANVGDFLLVFVYEACLTRGLLLNFFG